MNSSCWFRNKRQESSTGTLTNNLKLTTKNLLRPPTQRHRPIHRMHPRRTRPPRFDKVSLQREIPFRRPVRIVDQHQPRIVLQSFRLLDHRLLVLAEKNLAEYSENRNRQEEKISFRHETDPAKI